MIDIIKRLYIRYREPIIYLFFGGLTTVVNYLVYLPLYNFADLSASLSNCIAWAVAVLFAFLTNKPFVFCSNDWSTKTVIPEFIRFAGCRLGSGFIETLIIYISVDYLNWNGNIWKLVTSVIVVILNYFFSKLIVFKNKKS